MAFEITRNVIDEIKHAISDGNDTYLAAALSDLHPADVAEVFYKLNFSDADYLLKVLDNEFAAEILVELDQELRDKLISVRTSKEIAEIVVEHIDSDDAADVLAELGHVLARL
ncbi:MAG: magnesium transporter MgtE N-terminal domain-containing protein, partial [Luteibaculum sp.]